MEYLNQQKSQELLDLKDKWGWKDPRNTKEYEDCDICANDVFRDSWKDTGVSRTAFDAPPEMPAGSENGGATGSGGAPAPGLDQEALVKAITDQVMKRIQGAS